tara:strand:- start:512 stop:1522 length:1011 start_codon:yes stop_codon:yes gene_type:complete
MAVLGTRGGGHGVPNIMWLASFAWTPSATYEAYVYVIGAGGSGASAPRDVNYSVTGGGAGGCAISKLTLVSGVEYTFTCGAGGAGGGPYTSEQDGSAGGNSTFSGSGISTMTGNGGSAGVKYSGAGGSGATGGSASGGNIANFTGGAGGSTSSTRQASGGGAVGLWATGMSGEAGYDDPYPSRGGNLNRIVAGYEGISSPRSFDQDNPAIMQPFGVDISTYTQPFDAGFYDGDSTVETGSYPKYLHAGYVDYSASAVSVQVGQWWGKYDSNDHYSGPAGPFCGSNSLQTSYSGYQYGGRGSMGGGSGATLNDNGSASTFKAQGGEGCCMIFPITQG